MTVTDAELDLYTAIVAEISEGREREDALAAHSLTDEAFDALEARVEAESSHAMASGGDAVPAFILRLDRAMTRARAAATKGKTPIPFDVFTRALGALTSGRDPTKELERLGLDGRDLSRAIAAYATQLAKDPTKAQALARALSKTAPNKPESGGGSSGGAD